MTPSRLWLPGRVPEFNELIAAAQLVVMLRGKRIFPQYSKLKHSLDERIKLVCRAQHFTVPETHTCWTFLFVRENKRHDPDNISAGGSKICFDALQNVEVLKNDGWKQVTEIRHHFCVGSPGVLIVAAPVTFGRAQMLAWLPEGHALESRPVWDLVVRALGAVGFGRASNDA